MLASTDGWLAFSAALGAAIISGTALVAVALLNRQTSNLRKENTTQHAEAQKRQQAIQEAVTGVLTILAAHTTEELGRYDRILQALQDAGVQLPLPPGAPPDRVIDTQSQTP